MPPFSAFWHGLDIKERLELGFVDEAGARTERKTREDTRKALVTFLQDKGWLQVPAPDGHAVLRACLAFLSASRSLAVLVNLEDLWLEKQPQNIPGSGQQYPNWRRKARYSLQAFCQMPEVINILQEINRLRNLVIDSPHSK